MERKSLQILSSFWIKVIGFVTMTFDHIGFFIIMTGGNYRLGYAFRIVGRIAFPIFAFLCAEGVRRTHHPWKYFLRLLIMHLAIVLAESIYFYAFPNPQARADEVGGNAFADLTFIALTLILLKKKNRWSLLVILPIGLVGLQYGVELYETSQLATVHWFPMYLRTGYSLFGLLLGIGFFYASKLADIFAKPLSDNLGMSLGEYRNTNVYQRLSNLVSVGMFFVITLAFYAISYIGFDNGNRPYDTLWMQLQSYCLLAIPIILLYSGKRGYDNKVIRIISYLYYPAHMLLLIAIFWL